jgi:hypothetical protein
MTQGVRRYGSEAAAFPRNLTEARNWYREASKNLTDVVVRDDKVGDLESLRAAHGCAAVDFSMLVFEEYIEASKRHLESALSHERSMRRLTWMIAVVTALYMLAAFATPFISHWLQRGTPVTCMERR